MGGLKEAKARPTAKAPSPAPPNTPRDEDAAIRLRLRGGQTLTLRPPDERAAMRMAYIARNRRRWRGSEPSTADVIAHQLPWEATKAIAESEIVEVSIPFTVESHGWASRIYPWEWALSRLTKAFRRADQSLTVVRHLDVRGAASPQRAPLDLVCVVESTPGALGRQYDVEGERTLMLDSLRTAPADALLVRDPTASQLAEVLATRSPSLIHVAGFDIRQAAELIRQASPERTSESDDDVGLDGMMLRANVGARPDPIPSEALAAILTKGAQKPALVCFNFYNSAARTAPLTLAAGAGAAIGFQDTIDDNLAEQFFATFYRRLSGGPEDVLGAFRNAVDTIRHAPIDLQGACIVLWSRRSLLAPAAPQPSRRQRRQVASLPVATVPAAERIAVDAAPESEVNYALLHNGRSLFKKLQIARRHVEGRIADIAVAVTLYVGEDSFPFSTVIALEPDEVTVSVAERVVVPLTSSLIRTQCERMQSTLHLRVTCEGAIVREETFPVILAPVDEWTDTDENRLWLPSFVLPRDPAVVRIVESAQRYLMALADDPSAGFDGYQSVDPRGESPEEMYGVVDDQVRAIWCALLHEHRLSYVNPPPSYGTATQRLRVPSNILDERRGTCIDLALLLCACLEAIDIYPVMFLLEGHAFPGYWRSDTLHDAFRELRDLEVPDTPPRVRGGATNDRDQGGHTVGRDGFFEVRDLVTKGSVVPLETVWLTNYSGFGEALEEGQKNLRSPREFHSMIDIVLARRLRRPITPLPMLAGGGAR